MWIHPEVQRASASEFSRQAVLSELHQKIIHCRDGRTMGELLARYATVAIGRMINGADQGVGGMREMTAMRLQMATDRRSKLEQALSNILKAMNDTSKSIVQNMK